MADFTTNQDLATALFVGVLGRAPRPGGRDFLASEIGDNGIDSAASLIATSNEAQNTGRDAALDPVGQNNSAAAVVDQIATNLFGSADAISGSFQSFLETRVDGADRAELGQIVADVVLGSTGSAALNNRVDAANNFADAWGASNGTWGDDGSKDADRSLAENALDGVNDDSATVPSQQDLGQTISDDEGTDQPTQPPQDGAPSISAQTISFQENAAQGDQLGTITASDDGSISSLAITSAPGDLANYVNIAADGTVTLTQAGAGSALNDFETGNNSFTATVQATDNDGNTASADVTFDVTDDTADNPTSGTFPALPPAFGGDGPALVDAGTSASENINGNQSATVSGAGGQDRFAFDTGSSADLTVDDFANGDQLFFNVDQLGDIGVNNNTFGDGQVTLSAGQATVTVTNLSNTADQSIFDATSFETQFGDRGIGTTANPGGDPASDGSGGDGSGGNNGGGGSGSDLPALPSNGGPQPVDSGTSSSENINGNQSATVSGAGGDDRFIFDTGSSADLTIDDFNTGDQLFFQGIGQIGDIGVTNNDTADGQVTLTAGQADVTTINLGSDVDSQIFNATTFESALGGDAIGFA